MKKIIANDHFRRMAKHSPLLFQLMRPQKIDMDGNPCRALPNTEIVVDSFPRCGNTFLYHLLRETQPPGTRIAHHMHSAGHLAMGSRLGIPTISIVRHPQDACLSLIIRNPKAQAKDTLLNYLHFHMTLSKLKKVYIVDFNLLIHNTDKAFIYITKRYPSIKYRTIDDLVIKNVSKRVGNADRRDRERRGDQRGSEFTVGKPNAIREKIKEERRYEIESQEALLERCIEVYKRIISDLENSFNK
jgi:hypothetical protein